MGGLEELLKRVRVNDAQLFKNNENEPSSPLSPFLNQSPPHKGPFHLNPVITNNSNHRAPLNNSNNNNKRSRSTTYQVGAYNQQHNGENGGHSPIRNSSNNQAAASKQANLVDNRN